MKSTLIYITILLALTAQTLASYKKVQRSLFITRALQEKIKPTGSRGNKSATTLPDYTGKTPPKMTDEWEPTRKNFYTLETARLDAQKKFHTSEFKRYILQEELNKKRQTITNNSSVSILDRINGVKNLEDEYRIKFTVEDAIINGNQNARNPANERANQAGQKFWQALGK